MLQEAKQAKEEELQIQLQTMERRNPANASDIQFTQFLLDWLNRCVTALR